MNTAKVQTELLRAREARALARDDVASFTRISESRLADFESGNRKPTILQSERIAEAYGVPSYLLVGGPIPDPISRLVDFRRPKPQAAKVSVRGLRAILNAERVASFSWQMADALQLKTPNWLSSVPRANNVTTHARAIRGAVDVWTKKFLRKAKIQGKDEHVFFSAFRMFIESQGINVSINDAPEEDFLGFYTNNIHSTKHIFVNRKILSKKAQIFTLAHEYYHSMINRPGISSSAPISFL